MIYLLNELAEETPNQQPLNATAGKEKYDK